MTSRVGPVVPGVVVVDLDGAVTALAPGSTDAVFLDAPGSAVWRLATGEHDLAAVVEQVAEAYAVAAHVVREDVERTIAELVSRGLLAGPG